MAEITYSLRPIARTQGVGRTDSESTRGIDIREINCKEDLMRLLASMAGGTADVGLGAAEAGRAAATARDADGDGAVLKKAED